MITISIAQFFITLTAKKAVQGGEPAGPVLNSPKRISRRGRVFALLPLAVQKRVLRRQIAKLERLALHRLAETSPHLLADIGVVAHQDATFDGSNPQKSNVSLTILLRSLPPKTSVRLIPAV